MFGEVRRTMHEVKSSWKAFKKAQRADSPTRGLQVPRRTRVGLTSYKNGFHQKAQTITLC